MWVSLIALAPLSASAQTIGVFRWQLLPYCNVVTLTVTQSGGVYTLDGFDDQCGAAQRAATAGTAVLNPDGSIGIGLAIVTAPDGAPLHVAVTVSLATISGTWRDSSGGNGTFAFNPTSATGTPRPAPAPSFATGLVVGSSTFLPDGSFVARGVEDVGTVPATGGGMRTMWFAGRGAFRAGFAFGSEWDDPGQLSAAFGYSAKADGAYSFATGHVTSALGKSSTAMGNETLASGEFAVAMGNGTLSTGLASLASGTGTNANGQNSVAFGFATDAQGFASLAGGTQSLASGHSALAFGTGVTASAAGSIALGKNVSTSTRTGTFIFGDDSGVVNTVPTGNNQFVVRATGGVRLITATNLVNGCEVAPTTGNFICTGTITSSSDRHRKRDIVPLDGEDVLERVARIPVTTWSFIDEPGVRHAGPMAQDFRAAFGLGENDVTIGYTDINGINMRAIQALEQRTRDLMNEIAALRAEIAELKERR